MDNYKNKLQELCQKQRWILPKYSTTSVDGGWISTVTVNDKNFVGNAFSSKINAEQDVAMKALDNIKIISTTYSHPITPSEYIFIDLENVQTPIQPNVKFTENQYVVGVINIKSNLMAFETELRSKLELIICPSNKRDASDVVLIMHIDKLITLDMIDKTKWIYIVSRDHILETLTEILINRGYKVSCISTLFMQ